MTGIAVRRRRKWGNACPRRRSLGSPASARARRSRAASLRRGARRRPTIEMPLATELHCQVQVPNEAAVRRSAGPDQTLDDHGLRRPADWCYFPDTLARDGSPLGAIVCVSQPGARGHQLAVRPIGLLRTHDSSGYEEIVVCVPLKDAAWEPVRSVLDIPRRLRDEIERFARRRRPGRTEVATVGWLSRLDALTAIDSAPSRWAATVNGRG